MEEQLKQKMLTLGYSEEEIDKAMENMIVVCNKAAQVLAEAIHELAEQFSSAFEEMKDSLAELAEALNNTLDEATPSTRYLEPSKRMQYVNSNRFVTNFLHKWNNRDIRSMNRSFTRYCQKH